MPIPFDPAILSSKIYPKDGQVYKEVYPRLLSCRTVVLEEISEPT